MWFWLVVHLKVHPGWVKIVDLWGKWSIVNSHVDEEGRREDENLLDRLWFWIEVDNKVDTDEYGNDDNSENDGNYKNDAEDDKMLMNLCGEVDILVVVDDEVVCIGQSLLEAAHPLLGYRCHLRYFSHWEFGGLQKYDGCSGDGFKIFPESLKLFLGHHLASLDIVGVEENVVAGDKVARWTSDLQNLVPNTGE